jgi:broad specificity phosphatase PhoE
MTQETKSIYFIRHGQTDWNLLGKSQGQEHDIPLNDTGKLQAKITGKYLKAYRSFNCNFDLILTSPLTRAVQTAQIIAKKLELEHEKVLIMPDLIETKVGKFAGLANHEEPRRSFLHLLHEKYEKITDPIEKNRLKDHFSLEEFSNSIEGSMEFEDYDKLIERIENVLKEIAQCSFKKIAIISHSGFFNVLFQHLFSLSTLPVGDFTNGANCYICYCEFKNNRFKMISPMNTEHLSLKI